MYMDDIKVYAKNEKELVTQIKAIRRDNLHIGMESGTEKCAMLRLKRGKRQVSEAI